MPAVRTCAVRTCAVRASSVMEVLPPPAACLGAERRCCCSPSSPCSPPAPGISRGAAPAPTPPSHNATAPGRAGSSLGCEKPVLETKREQKPSLANITPCARGSLQDGLCLAWGASGGGWVPAGSVDAHLLGRGGTGLRRAAPRSSSRAPLSCPTGSPGAGPGLCSGGKLASCGESRGCKSEPRSAVNQH